MIQIRSNVFETNSSSTHSLVISTEDGSPANKAGLKKGDIILAQSENGYDVYDYKYKKTNQTIQLEENAKFFIKDNQLFAYSQKYLESFEEHFTTAHGDEMVVFGNYGYDG